jgi:hypothetical protein
MNKGFNAVGGLALPKGLDLSGSMWVQCAVAVFEGGRMEHDEKLGLINVGGKQVAEHVGPAKSFMRNWARAIRQLFYVPSNQGDEFTDDAAVARKLPLQSDFPNGGGDGVVFAAADFAFGDSNAAVSSAQSNLQGLILGPTPAIAATVLQEDTVGRIFKVESSVLNSGATFTVREVGLFAHLREQNQSPVNRRTMFMRDVVGSPVTVLNGQTALGRYTFTALI